MSKNISFEFTRELNYYTIIISEQTWRYQSKLESINININ